MDYLKFWLKTSIWLELIFMTISIVISIVFQDYIGILSHIAYALIVCFFIYMALTLVNEVINLRADLEESNERINQLHSEIRSTKISLDSTKEDIINSKIETLLPTTYLFKDGKRTIAVNGKFTYDKTVGLKCPCCGRTQLASNFHCKICKVDFHYKEQ